MALTEKTSRHLGVPYVYLPEQRKFLCQNGVLFTLEEYKKGIDINVEYERRAKEDMLYDYAYAKSTGLLRKKRNYANGKLHKEPSEEVIAEDDSKEKLEKDIQVVEKTWTGLPEVSERNGKSVFIITLLLTVTSVISMYISTLHTATYLYDYVDIFSSWLMSASVTAYNSTAFEVSVLFHRNKRNFIAFVFMSLWCMVTLFSMATTVSVFYDRFNFTETQIAEDNKELDSFKYSLELLQKKESDLRRAITLKEKDIAYRQEREFATTAVRVELNKLESDLQKNLSEQQKLLASKPEVKSSVIQRKESLFTFLGRILGLEGGILEFTMSTLSAIFVNLIAPLSLSAVIELSKRKLTK
jgi:hypothetical protein